MDEIRKKIEEFQNRLTPWPVRLKQSLLSCPAVLPAVALISGIILQFYFYFPPAVWAIIFVICFISYFLLIKNSNLIFISVLLCFACLGGFRLLYFSRPAQNDVRTIAIEDFTFARIKAKVISQPVVVKADERWYFSKYAQNLPYTSFYAKVYSAKTAAGWTNATGTIKFYISEDTNCVKIGDSFETFCKLQKFQSADNPGQFDTAEYMRRNNVYLSASVKSANAITVIDSPHSPKIATISIKSKLQKLASCAIIDDSQDNDSTSLIKAMLLGSRTKITPELYNAFISTGLVHLVALSGFNVGILAGLAWWLAKRLGLLHIGRSIVCITAVIVFLLVVPAQPSALRAGIMAAIFCISYMFNVRANPKNSLAISALVLLLIKPTDVFDAGFQLSFAATAGIILFYTPFLNFLMLPFENLKNPFLYKFLKIILAAFSTGCTAWLSAAPVIVWHFYRVQLLAPFWTVPAGFLVAIILVLGTFQILFAFILPTISAGLLCILTFLADIFSDFVMACAKIPFSQILIGKPRLAIILAICLLIFLWKLLNFRRFFVNFIYFFVIFLLFFAIFCENLTKFDKNLRVWLLSVGHGQAAILHINGKTTLIDAGSISQNNIGGNIVNPFLNYFAINKIESAFISHDDIDHYNGLPEIITSHKCQNIYTADQFIQKINNSPAAMDLKRFLSNQKLTLQLAPKKQFIGGAEITLLWPNELSNMELGSDNEASLVILVEYAGRKILFCSDIPADIQKELMNLYPDLDIDIMLTPHHGSQRTTDNDFITFFRPEYLITSCAEFRFAGLSERIKNFENSFYTCKDGVIFVKITPSGKIKINKK